MPESALHRAIKLHQLDIAIKLLKTDTQYNISVGVDQNLMMPLQQAAANGFVELVLWFIGIGVPIDSAQDFDDQSGKPLACHKTALYFSVQNHHALLSQILLCAGANVTTAMHLATHANNIELQHRLNALTLDIQVFRGLLHWTVKHYGSHRFNSHLLTRLRPQIDDNDNSDHNDEKKHDYAQESAREPLLRVNYQENTVPSKKLQQDLWGLIELAMKNNHTQLVLELITLNQHSIRVDPAFSSLGFWAAKHDNIDIYERFISPHNDRLILCLQQLRQAGENSRFQHYFAKATALQQDLYLNSKDFNATPSKLNAIQEKIYQSANYQQAEYFSVFVKNNTGELLQILAHILSISNYVALDLYGQCFSQDPLFTFALDTKNKDLLYRLMFINNQYPYELIQKNIQELLPLLQLMPDEPIGLTHRFISRATANALKDDRNPIEINAQRAYFRVFNIGSEQFLTLYSKRIQPDSFQTIDDLETEFPEPLENPLHDYARRLGVTLAVSNYHGGVNDQNRFIQYLTDTRLSPSVVMLEYSDDVSKAMLFATCKRAYRFQLGSYSADIEQFLRHLQQEIDQQSFWSHRNYHTETAGYLPLLPISLAGLTFFLTLAIYYGLLSTRLEDSLNAITDEMRHTPYSLESSLNCYSSLSSRYKATVCPSDVDLANCKDLCESYLTLLTEIAGPSAAVTITPILAGVSLLGIFTGVNACIDIFKSGKQRFEHLSLTDFSSELQTKGEQLFSQLAKLQAVPKCTLTIESSLVEIRAYLLKLKNLSAIKNTSRSLFGHPNEPHNNHLTRDIDERKSNEIAINIAP